MSDLIPDPSIRDHPPSRAWFRNASGGRGIVSVLAIRLALRQLRAEWAKLLAAIAGVMFACVLVFMQLGFRSSLFDSAAELASAMKGDLFIIHPLTQVLFRAEAIPRVRAYEALGVTGVAKVIPITLAQTTWRNPENATKRVIQIVGYDPADDAMEISGLSSVLPLLNTPDTVAFDRGSRPEFGDIQKLFNAGGPFRVMMGEREMTTVGLFAMGPSFAADGNAIMSEVNLRRVAPGKPLNKVDIIALRLAAGADVGKVREQLKSVLPGDVTVLDRTELVALEKGYWENGTPIGFIFTFGSVMGLVVGMVIVYQILFTDITDHLKEYATLKAMGYSNEYLCEVVMSAACVLAVLGFIPGALTSFGLYALVRDATLLPLSMTPERLGVVFALIFGMCAIAGLLAMRKLTEAQPAEMF